MKKIILYMIFLIVLSSFASAIDINSCGTYNSNNALYELNTSISTATTPCLIFTGTNVTFNGAGYDLNKTASGGIALTSTNSIHIENLSLNNNWDTGFNIGGGTAQTTRIQIENKNNNIIRNVYFQSHSANNNYGLYLYNSSNNIFRDNYYYTSSGSSENSYCGLINQSNNLSFENEYIRCYGGNGLTASPGGNGGDSYGFMIDNSSNFIFQNISFYSRGGNGGNGAGASDAGGKGGEAYFIWNVGGKLNNTFITYSDIVGDAGDVGNSGGLVVSNSNAGKAYLFFTDGGNIDNTILNNNDLLLEGDSGWGGNSRGGDAILFYSSADYCGNINLSYNNITLFGDNGGNGATTPSFGGDGGDAKFFSCSFLSNKKIEIKNNNVELTAGTGGGGRNQASGDGGDISVIYSTNKAEIIIENNNIYGKSGHRGTAITGGINGNYGNGYFTYLTNADVLNITNNNVSIDGYGGTGYVIYAKNTYEETPIVNNFFNLSSVFTGSSRVLYLENVSNNFIYNNTAVSGWNTIELKSVNNSNITFNTFNMSSSSAYALTFDSNSNNTIYNNLFTANNQLQATGTNYSNSFNISHTEDVRIYGQGKYFAGNYWAWSGNGYSETCEDTDWDGICDLQYNLTSDYIDFLPLSDKPSDIYGGNVTFNIYDETTRNLITQLVEIQSSSSNGTFLYNTTTGSFSFYFFLDNYTLSFESENYTTKFYDITFNTSGEKNYSIYLNNATEEVVFTVKDITTGELLEGASITQYRYLEGEWLALETKLSDITGRVTFNYFEDIEYKFTVSKEGYRTKEFSLSPISFAEYTIRLEKSIYILNMPSRVGVNIAYEPRIFYANRQNNFTFIINSPKSLLEIYGFKLEYPSGYTTYSGSNAEGQRWDINFSIGNTDPFDKINLTYYYQTSQTGLRNHSYSFEIINEEGVGNYTMIRNKDKTYGLGLFERMLVATLIILFVAGIGGLVAGAVAGAFLGLIVIGYLVWVGFVPIYAVLISLIIGFMIIAWRSD